MTHLLDGKIIRDEIKARLKAEVTSFAAHSSKLAMPTLAIIQVGKNPESTTYIAQKKKFGKEIGVRVDHVVFPESVSEQELLSSIDTLNTNPEVSGIIVQLPLPASLVNSREKIINAIDPAKDVDGLSAESIKNVWANKMDGFVPATAKAVMTLLNYYKIPVAGKRVTVVGRSELVGKPLSLCLINANATVTVCHSKTVNVPEETKRADILIVAAGKPHLIGPAHVSPGQVVVDVGINLLTGTKLEEEIPAKKLVGDVDFEAVKDTVAAISPVPGGVGPLTVASLFENVVAAFKRAHLPVKKVV